VFENVYPPFPAETPVSGPESVNSPSYGQLNINYNMQAINFVSVGGESAIGLAVGLPVGLLFVLAAICFPVFVIYTR
jgi:hypothetical protein